MSEETVAVPEEYKVSAAISYLEAALSQIDKVTGVLEERLVPVMRITEESPDNGTPETDKVGVPLADTIATLTAGTLALYRRLRTIERRLEI
jgi:hypothetical protein